MEVFIRRALDTRCGRSTLSRYVVLVVLISYIGLWPVYEDRFAEKRGFRLAHAAFGGAPDSRPA